MKLTWLGHSCFLLEQEGYTILLDPYTGVEGYPPLSGRKLLVNKILCSHRHDDHAAVDQAKLLPGNPPCPFSIRTVETFHDHHGGARRGTNTIHILTAGGLTAAHLGDLGHPLSPEQAAAIGPLDAVMIPVGGYYTIGAEEARAVCEALKPRLVIPMHYRWGSHGYPVLAEAEDFLSLWPAREVRRLEGPSFVLEKEGGGVTVPRFTEEI